MGNLIQRSKSRAAIEAETRFMTNRKNCVPVNDMMKLYKIPLQKLMPVTNFQARSQAERLKRETSSSDSDLQSLSYRYYPSWSTHTLVAFHGLVSSSVYLSSLAHSLAERKISQVLLPDLKGHGEDKRSLIWNGPEEVVQDFEEMLIHFRSRTAVERISFLGHSLGARWLLKILQMSPSTLSTTLYRGSIFLVAPFIDPSQISTDWIRLSNGEYQVNWPSHLQTGKERTRYPVEFLDPLDVPVDAIKNIFEKVKVHVIESTEDEVVKPLGENRWKELGVQSYQLVSSSSHMGLVMEPAEIDRICRLIESKIIAI